MRLGVIATLGLVATGCPAEPDTPPATPPAPTNPAPDAPPVVTGAGSEAGRNLVMGTGEPVEPRPFTLEDRLLDAVRRGDRAAVERTLEAGVAVDSADALGRSTLLLATRDAGSLELAQLLHARGASVDRADAEGRTPLSYAAAAGRLEIVRWLIDEGARVDAPDDRGRTPLFQAVLRDRRDVVADLIEHGADPNVSDRFRDTPLMLACAKGFDAMARLLLDHGADPAARDQEGRTAAERAAPNAPACRPSHGGAT
ncbi:MAG TPA: ankyrin repeat domain-containing protein [Myxococcota bacterium]|nr:ankyrin repeat domain-containing protein [Myxococcota bacterium]